MNALPPAQADPADVPPGDPPPRQRPKARAGGHKQSQLLKNALKQEIRRRGFRYQDIAEHLGISVMTVKRHLNSDRVSIEAIEDICACLGLTFIELAELAKNHEVAENRDLELEQECALATDHALGLVRFLLYSGWTVEEIMEEYAIDATSLVGFLARLDRLKLIELQPGNRVRIRGARTIEWRTGGPMRQVIERDIRQNFMTLPFADTTEYFGYETVFVTEDSLLQLEEQMRQLVKSVRMLHQVDQHQSNDRKRWYTLLVAKRANLWNFVTPDGEIHQPRSLLTRGSGA